MQVPVPVTLLKDFDPMFHKEKKSEEEEEVRLAVATDSVDSSRPT